MMRLCLLLFSCCVFGSFEETEIDEILQAFEGINSLNLSSEWSDTYLEIPKYISKTCHAEYLKIYVKSLKTLQIDCENDEICSKVEIEFQKLLSKVVGNLSIVQRHLDSCVTRPCTPPAVKEVKLTWFLKQFNLFLNHRNRRLC